MNNWLGLYLYITILAMIFGVSLLIRGLVLLIQKRNASSLPFFIGAGMLAGSLANLIVQATS